MEIWQIVLLVLYFGIGVVLGIALIIAARREPNPVIPLVAIMMMGAWPAFLAFFLYDLIRGRAV